MADELTTQILVEIRDAVRENGRRIDDNGRRIDDNGRRIDDTNERLAVLATLTRSIDGRLAKIEAREPDRLFLPRRVDQLEVDRDDHEARIAALEARNSSG